MLQPMQHLFLFSRRSLEQALRAEGFSTVTLGTCFKTLRLDYLINQVRAAQSLSVGEPWRNGTAAA